MQRRREKKAHQKGETLVEKVTNESAQSDKIVCGRNMIPTACGTCGDKLTVGGPIWHDKIHNIDFVKQMHATCLTKEGKKYGTQERIKGVLGGIIDEDVLGDKALSFDFNQVCSNIKVTNPTSSQIIAGFASLDLKVVQTYYDPQLWKTDATPEVVYDVFKAWKKQVCEKEKTDFVLNAHP